MSRITQLGTKKNLVYHSADVIELRLGIVKIFMKARGENIVKRGKVKLGAEPGAVVVRV